MNWMECIRICIGGGGRGEELLREMKAFANELDLVPGLDFDFYHSPTVPGDHLIVLRWKGGPSVPIESDIAIQLIRELKRLGIVEHTVWRNTAGYKS